MKHSVRLFSEDMTLIARSSSEGLEVLAQGSEYLRYRSFMLQIEELIKSATWQSLDLLYRSPTSALDLKVGARFAAQTDADEVGFYVEGAGPLIVQGGKPVLQRFFADRLGRHDVHVYEAGGSIRTTWETGKQDDVRLPIQIYLGLTQKCNRSCSFCVSRSFDPAVLPLDTVRKLAEQLRDSVQVVALTGAGEALVHPHFWDAIEILAVGIPNVQFKMNSSGVGLGKAAERLLQYPFRNITISLNAATPGTYGRFIGGGFDRVVESIHQLVVARARSASGGDLRLTISMVLMKSTVSELPDLVSKAFELGVEEVQGIYLMINSSQLEAESPWHQPERTNALLDAASERAATLGVALRSPPRFNEKSGVSNCFQPSSLPETQGQFCVEPWSTVYIRPDGDIISCPYGEEALGNIFKLPLSAIWNSQRYQELRRSLTEKDYQPMCAHCCGFNEAGRVDDYLSHWLGDRNSAGAASRSLPVLERPPA
jgi:radical SAM protein with 4Fe4S-binding SPASM domain